MNFVATKNTRKNRHPGKFRMNDTLVESKKPQQVDEFETRPVPEASQKGHRAFWGMYSGEHAAGTEFRSRRTERIVLHMD